MWTGVLITEMFISWDYHPTPNPTVRVEQALKQLPQFDESDVKSTRYYQTGLSLAIPTWNTRGQCQSSSGLAYLQWYMGDPTAGQMYASEAQRLAQISADLYKEAQALDIEATCWYTLGNYKYAASLCARARDLLVRCGRSGSRSDIIIMSTQAEIYKLKSEYAEARDIHMQILHGAPVELAPYLHASAVLNITEVEVFLDVPLEDAIACDAIMGALHLRERNQPAAQLLFHKCLSLFWGHHAEMVNYCLERLGDRSLWGSTDWPSSWTIVYLVHASKLQQKLDVHKALQFLGDIFCTEGDQDTAVSLLTVALEGFTQMDVHRSRAECMLQLGYISKDNGDILKATEHWRRARSLFEWSSQVKQVALIDEELLSITGDVHGEYTRSLPHLSDIHVPSATLKTTTGSLVEETGETENPGLGDGKELVSMLV
ncbi:hypothetical protein DFH09DRAFT_1077922 [Mycena vulgaris]|nr:hypothetical protein DFH09DRAFT_1077922 [Mycena vulgaris]